ncbi:MAG: hypothetical protein NTV56_19995 [Alphaproteobacteria bacterium]|nr:hypothetical protein [Alphaproteobacteria bacterium]
MAPATENAAADEAKAFTADDKRDFMLAALRRACAHLRAKEFELEEIGVALRFRMINAEDAVAWLDHIGATDTINTPPWTNRVEVAPADTASKSSPPATDLAMKIHRNFERKMAKSGKIDRILRGAAP